MFSQYSNTRMTSPKRVRRAASSVLFEETAETRRVTLTAHRCAVSQKQSQSQNQGQMQSHKDTDSNKENRATKHSPRRSPRKPLRRPLRPLDTATHRGYIHDIRRDLTAQL